MLQNLICLSTDGVLYQGFNKPFNLKPLLSNFISKGKKNANNTNKNHDDNDDFIPLSNRSLGFVLIQDGAF